MRDTQERADWAYPEPHWHTPAVVLQKALVVRQVLDGLIQEAPRIAKIIIIIFIIVIIIMIIMILLIIIIRGTCVKPCLYLGLLSPPLVVENK